MLRSLAALVAVAVALTSLHADDKKDQKIDAAKLVGRWKVLTKPSGVPEGTSGEVEFAKGGKLKHKITIEKMKFELGGTYEVKGAALTFVLNDPKGDVKGKGEILKLTDKVLHVKDEDGTVNEFERVAEKEDEDDDK